MRADLAIKQQERRRARQIGIGLVIGALLAFLGVTEGMRTTLMSAFSTSSDGAISPVALFSSYLIQTVVLVFITFRAWQHDRHVISAAAWVLATWEAIASIVRRDLLLIKNTYPVLYDLTALIHVVGAASLFLAMGYRASRRREREERERRLGARERQRRV